MSHQIIIDTFNTILHLFRDFIRRIRGGTIGLDIAGGFLGLGVSLFPLGIKISDNPEIWVSTPDSDNVGVSAVSLDLTYNPQFFTAVEVDFTDSAFTENQSGQINDAAGRVIGISGTTSRSDIGDDGFALLARIA